MGDDAPMPLDEDNHVLYNRRRNLVEQAIIVRECVQHEQSPLLQRQNLSRLRKLYAKFFFGFIVLFSCFGAFVTVGDEYRGHELMRQVDTSKVSDYVLEAMNFTVDPCEDFYEYACGAWMRKFDIPEDLTYFSRSFTALFEEIQKELRVILEVDLQDPTHPNAIAGRFYKSCMSGVAAGPLDILPLEKFELSFRQSNNASSLAVLLAKLHEAFSSGLFSASVNVDDKHPSRYTLFLSQGGLGLSHPSMYTSTGSAGLKIREAYKKLIEEHLEAAAQARLVPLAGLEELAENVLELEKRLASFIELGGKKKTPEDFYNPIPISELPDSLHFQDYLEVQKVDTYLMSDVVIVYDPKYVENIAVIMSRVAGDNNLRDSMKGYLAFHLIRHYANIGIMGKHLYIKNFEFSAMQSGQKKITERWKICQSRTTGFLGDSLGEAYVNKHFSEKQKKAASRFVREITEAFSFSLARQDWMDEKTRSMALEKLNAINFKLGHTTKWDQYTSVHISSENFAANMINLIEYKFRRNADRVGKRIDETEWGMNSFEANAYYSNTRNEIAFPAGILRAPFFSFDFSDAMNYGGIGTTVGHEMSHGFDFSGHRYDKNGRLTSWWSTESEQKYMAREKCFVDLYSGYRPPNVNYNENGYFTLDENLADANGVKIAFSAFKRRGNNSDSSIRAPDPKLARMLTNHQLFFVSYAQKYCEKETPKSIKLSLISNPHSLGRFRVQGPLSQNREFANVFNCKPGSMYYPEKICRLW